MRVDICDRASAYSRLVLRFAFGFDAVSAACCVFDTYHKYKFCLSICPRSSDSRLAQGWRVMDKRVSY